MTSVSTAVKKGIASAASGVASVIGDDAQPALERYGKVAPQTQVNPQMF